MIALISIGCLLLFVSNQVQAKPGHTLIQKGDDLKDAVDDVTANKINALKTSWKAKVSNKFRGAKVSDVKRMLGSFTPSDPGYPVLPDVSEVIPASITTTSLRHEEDIQLNAVSTRKPVAKSTTTPTRSPVTRAPVTTKPSTSPVFSPSKLPTLTPTNIPVIPVSFASDANWPNCASVINHIRDQSDCGSCWAFGTTEVLNDRYCITYGTQTLFSPEDVNDCCSGNACGGSNGCNGGYPSSVWSWFQSTGVCSGGDYSSIGSGTTCKPYSLLPCAHHVTPVPPLVQCPTLSPTGILPTPVCTGTCSEASYGVSYANDKKKAKSVYSLGTVAKMQLDIMKNGPITVTFDVYSDFLLYSSGVYQLTPTATLEGGHCVKLTGWGVDAVSGLPYWQCNNQWGPSWGEQGSFRILRGSNMCGIESGAVAGLV